MGEIGPDRYVKVLPGAFDHTEFHVVVATGSHPDLPRLPEATPNVSFFRMVPGISVLDRSDAVIFHGGQNTAMASLLHGVPSLIFPGSDFERDFNARGMAGIGAGIHMKSEDFTPRKIRESLGLLLKGDYSRNADDHGQVLRELGGPGRAADLILRAAE
jgi:UDP:flavonoid glycosyltransferase YjiC (YdhE family)